MGATRHSVLLGETILNLSSRAVQSRRRSKRPVGSLLRRRKRQQGSLFDCRFLVKAGIEFFRANLSLFLRLGPDTVEVSPAILRCRRAGKEMGDRKRHVKCTQFPPSGGASNESSLILHEKRMGSYGRPLAQHRNRSPMVKGSSQDGDVVLPYVCSVER